MAGSDSHNNEMSSVKLVITVALNQELPREFLRERGVPVVSMGTVRAPASTLAPRERGGEHSGHGDEDGGNGEESSGHGSRHGGHGSLHGGGYGESGGKPGGGHAARQPGILVVVSGPGPQASQAAAQWIVERVRPVFVVNIGSTGCAARSFETGGWYTPRSVSEMGSAPIPVDERLPLPWPQGLHREIRGRLLTVEAPVTGGLGEGMHGDLVDMEAASQARVFGHAGIAFSVLKYGSDRCDSQTVRSFKQSLPRLREEFAQILSFLARREKHDEVSVVIPVHNREQRIAACVESVLAQSLPPREIIVVDDASADDSARTLAGFGDKIEVVKIAANRGVSYARNLGVKHASGQRLAFLDSDDQWMPQKLENQREFLRRYPFYRVMQSEELWIRNGVRVNPRPIHAKPEGFIFEPSLERCLVSPSSVMMDKALFETLGGFDESMRACEDYDLWLRLSRSHAVGLDRRPGVVKHGGHRDQLSRRYPAMDRFRVYSLLKALRSEDDPRYAVLLRRSAMKKLDILANGAAKRGFDEISRRYRAVRSSLAAGQEVSDFGTWLVETVETQT